MSQPPRRRVARVLSISEHDPNAILPDPSLILEASQRSISSGSGGNFVASPPAAAVPVPPLAQIAPPQDQQQQQQQQQQPEAFEEGSVRIDQSAFDSKSSDQQPEAADAKVPPHKRAFPAIYSEKSQVADQLLREVSQVFAAQFAGAHLTPIELFGADDDVDALTSAPARGSSFRFNQRRSSIAGHSVRGAYSVLSRLSGNPTDPITSAASGAGTTGAGGGGSAALFNADQKLTFTSDGATGSGQRIGETAPPTVLLTVTPQPVRAVGGMLLIDGIFAFHNSPFLDKRVPPGRLRIPVDIGTDIVQRAKEWQQAVLASAGKSAANALAGADAPNTSPKALPLLGKMRRGADVPQHQQPPQAVPLSRTSSSHTLDDGNTAAVVYHEYAGAAAPADDWIVQTFQLIDPASGMPCGPVLVRAYKTPAAIRRRERERAAALTAANMDAVEHRNRAFGRRGTLLMEKYGLGEGSGLSGGGGGASVSGRRRSRVGFHDTPGGGAGRGGSVDGGGGGGADRSKSDEPVPGTRIILPEEEMLRFRDPALFELFAGQDLFELIAATTVVRRSFQQYRSSFLVRRNMRRMFFAIGVVQRFCRSLSRRRQSALERITRDWCVLEDRFVSRLRAYEPLPGDVIDGIVVQVLLAHAVTSPEDKRRKIEDAWRASRWEIAVAWRITTMGEGDGTEASAAFEEWQREHHISNARRKVFSYFISAAPLFEAAQRRLAVQSAFGRDSVLRTPAMVEILRKAGCSVPQMQRRRREIFLFEAQAAERDALRRRAEEERMLAGELVRRAAKAGPEAAMRRMASFGGGASSASTSMDGGGGQQQFRDDMLATGTRRGAVFVAPDASAFSQRMSASFLGDSTTSASGGGGGGGAGTRRGSAAGGGSSFRLPPRPQEYDEGDFTAIQHVLRNENFEIFDASPSPYTQYFGSAGFGGGGGGGGVSPRGGRVQMWGREEYEQTANDMQMTKRRPFGENAVPPWVQEHQRVTRRRSPKRNAGEDYDDGISFGRGRGLHFDSGVFAQNASQSQFGASVMLNTTGGNSTGTGTGFGGSASARRASSSPRRRSRAGSIAMLTEQRKAVLRRGIPLPWVKEKMHRHQSP